MTTSIYENKDGINMKIIYEKYDPLYKTYNLDDILYKNMLGKGTFSHVYKTFNKTYFSFRMFLIFWF